MSDIDLQQDDIETQFRAWWKESYGIEPGKHAVMTHTAFALEFHLRKLASAVTSSRD